MTRKVIRGNNAEKDLHKVVSILALRGTVIKIKNYYFIFTVTNFLILFKIIHCYRNSNFSIKMK